LFFDLQTGSPITIVLSMICGATSIFASSIAKLHFNSSFMCLVNAFSPPDFSAD
jgi:hypothetical protein